MEQMLHFLEAQDIISIDTTGPTHKISVIQKAEEDALNDKEKETVKYVLKNFADHTPMELEAMTTLDYVANVMLEGRAEDHTVIREVIKIKDHKFSEKELEEDLKILKRTGYVA